jgi:hypothetical protein
MKVYGIKSKNGDAEILAPDIREIDKKEVFASSGVSMEFALKRGFELSDKCYTGYADDKPFCMYGAVKLTQMSDIGCMWLLATDLIKHESVARGFIKGCRQNIIDMKKGYKYLTNYTHVDNEIAIRWLKWVGATFEKPKQIGYSGEYFTKFIF